MVDEISLRILNVGDAILDRDLQKPEWERKVMHKSEARGDLAFATKAPWQGKTHLLVPTTYRSPSIYPNQIGRR